MGKEEKVIKFEKRMPELLPCPFCGDSFCLKLNLNVMCVECDNCGASGPYRTDGNDSCENAAELWNERTSE